MKVDVGTFAAEFPNDNPSLHGGALWVCRDVVGPPMVEIVERASGSAVTALGILPAAIIAGRGPAPEIHPQYEDAGLAISETAAAIARAADILSRALHVEDVVAAEPTPSIEPDDATTQEENMAINALVAEAVHAAIAEVKAAAEAAACAQRAAEAEAQAAAEVEALAAIEAMVIADAEAAAISARVADAVMAALAAEATAEAEAAAQAEAEAAAQAEAEAAAQAEAEAAAQAEAEAAAQAEAEAEAAAASKTEAEAAAAAKAEAEAAAQAEAAAAAKAEAEAAAAAKAEAEVEVEARPARPSGIMLVGERASFEDEGHDELVVEELEPLAAETEIEIVAAATEAAPEPAPMTTRASEAATILPPANDDPFQLFVAALESLAIAEGSPWAASVVGPLLGQGIAPAGGGAAAQAALVSGGVLDGDVPTDAFLAVARAWRDILRGTSEDWSACGAMMLDEWAADVLARLMGAPDRVPSLRRDLRTRGVAAFGLVEAA